MACSFERYRFQLATPMFQNPAVPTRAFIVIGILELAILVPTCFIYRYQVYGLPLQLVVLGLNAILARRWHLKYWSREKGRSIRSMMEVIEIEMENRVSKLLALFDCSTPRLASDQVSVEISHAEHLLQDASRGAVTIPGWLVPAVLLLGNSAITMMGKVSDRDQWTLLIVGALTVFVSFGIHLIGSALPTKRVRIAEYLALLRRAKRRLDLEAIEQASREHEMIQLQRDRPAAVGR